MFYNKASGSTYLHASSLGYKAILNRSKPIRQTVARNDYQTDDNSDDQGPNYDG